jgi:anti-sigma regulatory factor (Ser/Thr protein kinase)
MLGNHHTGLRVGKVPSERRITLPGDSDKFFCINELRIQASFPPVPASAGEARQLVSRALDQWGLEAAEETTLLLVTELVSNVVRHAKTALTLLLAYDGSRLHVGVSDHDRQIPVLAKSSVKTHHGWGLQLVSALASDWGTRTSPEGKTVWFDLNVDELSGEDAGQALQ